MFAISVENDIGFPVTTDILKLSQSSSVLLSIMAAISSIKTSSSCLIEYLIFQAATGIVY